MADERKPLTDMRLFRTANGGWVIRTDMEDFGRSPGTSYAYSSDRDLLTALPGLIGAEPPESVEEFLSRINRAGAMVITDDPR